MGLTKELPDDQAMVIDGLDQDNGKTQDVTIISPQQSIDSGSADDKDSIMLADDCNKPLVVWLKI